MSKVIVISFLGMLMVLLIACSGEKKAEMKTEQQTDTTMTTAVVGEGKATCPSCNMVMDKSEMIEYVSGEDTLYFCSEGCKKHYLAQQEEPETEE